MGTLTDSDLKRYPHRGLFVTTIATTIATIITTIATIITAIATITTILLTDSHYTIGTLLH